MSSDQQQLLRPSLAVIKQGLADHTLSEISYPRLELKSNWKNDHGKSISAIANHESLNGGWMLVGVDDTGKLVGKDKHWCEKNYEKIGNQINQFLNPQQAVKDIYTESFDGCYCILIEVQNPGYITSWQDAAYKRTGSSVQKMTASERTALALRLPGDDYSSLAWQGKTNSALVLEFAKKMIKHGAQDLPKDLSRVSSAQILQLMNLEGKMAAGILFGDVPVRIAHYDADDQVASNVEEKGLYTILNDSFISHIQTASERKGATIKGNSVSSQEYQPYPTKLLREILANAVAHALYQRKHGEIIVDIHFDRITVRNNASLEAEVFAKQWFAKQTMAKNKLLMETLRIAGITDELGTGKANVFRLSIEAGKEEPVIDFLKLKGFAKWQLTVYSNQRHEHIGNLLHKLNELLPSPLHARLAAALVLWKDRTYREINEYLDNHHQKIANEVVAHEHSPVMIASDDKLFVKRWADVALTGQSSKGFTPSEEKIIMKILARIAHSHGHSNQISTHEARQLIGLGKSQSETVQLSNLLRKWERNGRVKKVKRGMWQFNGDQ